MKRLLSMACMAGLLVTTGGAIGGCDSTASQPASALKLPIDFAYACEGEGGTQPPANDETAASINNTRMCPDVGGAQGELYGVALNRQPAGLIVMQMNPAAGTRGFIDADYFVPGTSPIPVGEQPIQVLRATDFSAFFVLSAGDQRIDRVIITGHDDDGLHYEAATIPLPGVPVAGLMLGADLLVAARDEPVMWIVSDAASGGSALKTVTLPGHILHMEAIPGDATSFIATYRDHAWVARVNALGEELAKAGLVPQCRDGIDNDDDDTTDRGDGDCLNLDDDDESSASGAPRAEPPTSTLAHFEGAAPCLDGIDNDGDGRTDSDDPACDGDDEGELLPACDDGIDNDGDGLTDGADETCYVGSANYEGQAPDDGPFHPTFVDAGAAGRFVYVLDERSGQIVVFDYSDTGFSRVNVNAESVTPPLLRSVAFASPSGDVREDAAIPAVRQPALFRRGMKNIEVLEGNAFSLSSSRIRGELWERMITPATPGAQATVSFSPNDAEWKPGRCAPDHTDACQQPDGDDDTWLLFGANLDGRMQLIEAVRRGVPIHRLAQREVNPTNRTMDVTAPRLTLRGRLINARGEPKEGFPFLGAAIEELLVSAVDETSPAELRRFGVWPPADLEEAPSESWTVSYEGKIPDAQGRLGRLVAETTDTATLVDAERAFCDEGVAAGDWVQIEAPVSAVAPALVHSVAVTLTDGTECPVVASETALIEVRVLAVGMSSLTLDRTTARLRPELPVLDIDAITEARISRRACEQALADIDDTLGRPENLKASNAFAAAALPARFTYEARVGDRWALVGTRSGFLHRQRWNGTSCVVDETLDARLSGRLNERTMALAAYSQCPPPAEQLAVDSVDALAPAESRFENPSFSLDVFPGCERSDDGAIVAAPTQQDTTFAFTVTGPYQGSSLSVSDSILVTKVPMLDFRRQQVQLDASARRASILQMRLGNPKVIATFE